MLFNSISPDHIALAYQDLNLPLPLETTPDNFMSVRQFGSFFRILFNASYLLKDRSEKALTYRERSAAVGTATTAYPCLFRIAHERKPIMIASAG